VGRPVAPGPSLELVRWAWWPRAQRVTCSRDSATDDELASLPVGPPQGFLHPLGFRHLMAIRGPGRHLITPAWLLQVGLLVRAMCLPPRGPVLIDMGLPHQQSRCWLRRLTAGLTAAGREVWNSGPCPTRGFPRSIRRLGAAGGF